MVMVAMDESLGGMTGFGIEVMYKNPATRLLCRPGHTVRGQAITADNVGPSAGT